ncbi:MAG: GHMP family kinase ATP-binding protein [Candidatus Zipacnadales bacterium]
MSAGFTVAAMASTRRYPPGTIVESTAPSRIDLAGGTLDIHPLYLFEEGGITVNAAITVRSEVRLTVRSDRQIHLRSWDGELTEWAACLEELQVGGELDLVARLVRFYAPQGGLSVETRNEAPRGSGLGASSSLLIALSGALRALTGAELDDMTLVRYGADIEAQNVRVPTGRQDYYPAMFGGINAIWFDVRGDRVEPLCMEETCLREFEERLVLSFTGESRFSGTSNWNMIKRYIDDGGTTRANMKAIKATALAMRKALLEFDLDRFAELLDDEWQNRRRLAEGVSTPRLEELMGAALEAGAMANRVCGAGGGGCMTSFCKPGRAEEVRQALVEHGATIIPYRIARRGLEVTIRPAPNTTGDL